MVKILERVPSKARISAGVASALVAASAVGCDFSVTNPGPVNDVFLDNQAAFESVVNGIPRELSGALNWIGVDVAIRTRELHATQANEYVGVYFESHKGTQNPEFDAGWTEAQAARWNGDAAIARIEEVLGAESANSQHLAQAYLWTGYAYRLMGEYFCEVTVDSGPALPSTEFLEIAVQRFAKAEEIATVAGLNDVALAAMSGRASVLVDLGRWSEAATAAREVPTDFSWKLPYYRQGDWRYYNALYWYSANEPYRSLTVWNTPYEDYYLETGDPRTAWASHPEQPVGTGSLQPWGPIPWYTQEKYPSPEAAIELSSGQEMRLIEAEAHLRDGRSSEAMALINGLRTAAGVDARPAAASLAEAWGYLKQERGIVLWLEGRRLADLRRWNSEGTPGALAPEEWGFTEGGPDLTSRVLCVGIPNSERDSNPHLESL